MELLFYPYEFTYRIIGQEPVIYIFGKTKDGQKIALKDNTFKPYFWAVLKDYKPEYVEDIKKISFKEEQVLEVKEASLGKRVYFGEESQVLKITVNIPGAVPVIAKEVSTLNFVECVCESDILFTRRYIVDRNITPLKLFKVKVEEATEQSKIPVYNLLSIKEINDDSAFKPKVLAFDIETYNPFGKNIRPEKDPILMLSIKTDSLNKVLTWKRFKTVSKDIEFLDSERDLIERFKQIVDTEKPDFLVGYYSDGFDLPYIIRRAKVNKIKLDLGIDYSEVKLAKGDSDRIKIHGLVHIDILKFIKRVMGTTLETDFFTLDAVSEELLNEKKVKVDIEKLAYTWDNAPDKLEIYASYNAKDSDLTFRLFNKIYPNIEELTKLVSAPVFDLTRMSFSKLVESYLIKHAFLLNVCVPNKPSNKEISERILLKYKGAFVFEPTPGLYKDIAVFDFRSFYPTVIVAHNISPETINCSCCKKANEFEIENKKYRICKKKKGLIPIILKDLISRRMTIKEILKKESTNPFLKARSEALKTLSNSFYGYLGFYGSRWYSFDAGGIVTGLCRNYIMKVMDIAEKKDYTVLYGDTDSVFLRLNKNSIDDAKKLVEKINMDLPDFMELEFENYFKSGIFVSSKAANTGAKKRYALLGKDGKLKIRGFESVRRNVSAIAKEVQLKVLKLVLEDKIDDAYKCVSDVVLDMRNRKINVEKLIIYTQITKPIEEYEQIGPHVAVARKLVEKGKPVGPGTIVKYVITAGDGKIRDRAREPEDVKKNEYDANYYISHQILPAVKSIFAVIGLNTDKLLDEKKDHSLGKFF